MVELSVEVTVPHGGEGTHTLVVAIEIDDDRLTDPTLVEDVCGEIRDRIRPVLSDERARRVVTELLADGGVDLDELRRYDRSRDLLELRGDVALMLRREGWSLPRIGRLLHRDHTTVLHAIRQAEARERQRPDPVTPDWRCEECAAEAMGGGRWCLRHFQAHVADQRSIA